MYKFSAKGAEVQGAGHFQKLLKVEYLMIFSLFFLYSLYILFIYFFIESNCTSAPLYKKPQYKGI